MKRLPAENCVRCNVPFTEIGGFRMYWNRVMSVFVRHQQLSMPGLDDFRGVRLTGKYSQMFVIMGGTEWRGEQTARAIEQAQAGHALWYCQRCGGRACTTCGRPWKAPPACGVLHDDGSTGYMPVLLGMVDNSCKNPLCRRKDSRGKDTQHTFSIAPKR